MFCGTLKSARGMLSHGVCAVFYVRSPTSFVWYRVSSVSGQTALGGLSTSLHCCDQRMASRPDFSRVLARVGALCLLVYWECAARQMYVYHGFCLGTVCFPQFLSGIDGLFSLNTLARSVDLQPWDMHPPHGII